MKIKLTFPVQIGERWYHPGEIIELGDKKAHELIDEDWAIPWGVPKGKDKPKPKDIEVTHGNR